MEDIWNTLRFLKKFILQSRLFSKRFMKIWNIWNLLNFIKYLFLDLCDGVTCYNEGKCDIKSGICDCSKTGYTGENCKERM